MVLLVLITDSLSLELVVGYVYKLMLATHVRRGGRLYEDQLSVGDFFKLTVLLIGVVGQAHKHYQVLLSI